MTNMKKYLKDYRSRERGRVYFGNNHHANIQGYGTLTNGYRSIKRVAYVEGSKHDLISASQLVVGNE